MSKELEVMYEEDKIKELEDKIKELEDKIKDHEKTYIRMALRLAGIKKV